MSNSQLNTNDDLLEAVLGDFLDESDQLLTQLNENLLQLDEWVQSLDENHEQRCDQDLLNEMFRAAHSLKGSSLNLGATVLADTCRALEKAGREESLDGVDQLATKLEEDLAHASPEADTRACQATTPFGLGGSFDALRHLVLHVFLHVADGAHRGSLVDGSRCLFRGADRVDIERSELDADIGKVILPFGLDRSANLVVQAWQVKEPLAQFAQQIGHPGDDNPP